MSPTKLLTRREVLKTAALGAAALPLLSSSAWSAEPPAAAAKKGGGGRGGPGRENGLRLGVATISTQNLSLDDTIEVLKAVRIVNVNVFRRHVNLETASVDEIKAVSAKLKAAGMVWNSTGVTNLPNDEAKIRKAFENAKAGELAVLVCKPELPALPLLDKLVKEYDLKLAIHNHGPEDKVYPSPYTAFKAVESFDARIGLCIDVSHTMRAGDKPDETIRKCASRLYDVHIKDTKAVPGAMADIPVEHGGGNIDTRGILVALLAIQYSGVLTYEYEKVAGNPAIGLAESLGYLRGMLKAFA
jgi:sugar phosphate isomerase/epimerase